MGVQLTIDGEHLRAAGFVAKVDVEYGWDDCHQCETETEYPYWEAPNGQTIGSYMGDCLCIDWNHWGGNRARFTPLLAQYGLLDKGVIA